MEVNTKDARFQVTAAKQMRTALFWVIKQRPKRRQGITVTRWRNNPEVRSFHLTLSIMSIFAE